ncbi:hypothetical protein BpHYR1_044219, partial [Brachionus plicatilis]
MEILIKQNLAIDGHGYECSKKFIKVSTYTNFFGARSSKRSVDIQKLSKLEYGNCEFDENPIENFKWLSTVLTTGYYCRLQKTKIRYKNKILNEICNADNLECNLGDSILIWNREISNLTLLSESENAVHDLLLADSDSIELKTFTMIDKIKEEICNYKLSTIRAFREHKDRFNILYIGFGSLVLYTRDGIIFAPNCSKISSINLNSYSDCSLDPQIKYSENDKVVKGYLTKNNIIRKDNTFN